MLAEGHGKYVALLWKNCVLQEQYIKTRKKTWLHGFTELCDELVLVTNLNLFSLQRDTSGRTMADGNFWKTVDFQKEPLPDEVTSNSEKVTVRDNKVNIMVSVNFDVSNCHCVCSFHVQGWSF